MATESPSRRRRTSADWETLANELLPELQAGKSFADFDDRIGANADALRIALAKLGFDSHGEPLKVKKITAARPETLVRKIANRRYQGAPWWLIVAETDCTYGEIRRLLIEHGRWEELSGRLVQNGNGDASVDDSE